MGLLERFNNWLFEPVEEFTNEAKPSETNLPTKNKAVGISDGCIPFERLWQYVLAKSTVSNLLGSMLADVKWKTFKEKGVEVKEDVYYRLNIKPNKKQTASEFWKKFANKLIFDGEVLVIELEDKQLFVADIFSYADGQENDLVPNTYVNVQIGNTVLYRSFKQGKTALFFRLPGKDDQLTAFNTMQSDYDDIKKIITKGANKAMGTKYNLKIDTTKMGNNITAEYIRNITEEYVIAMDKPDAVFITFQNEELVDMTEQQRGSEVEQVLKVVENNTNINKDILANVSRAYGIPLSIATMEITTDNADAIQMFMTTFIKPFIRMIDEGFSDFYLEKDKILKGAKVSGDVHSIMFIDIFTKANAIDKLLSSAMYTINEMRENIDDDPVDGGDSRYITKNYQTLEEFKKGGEN